MTVYHCKDILFLGGRHLLPEGWDLLGGRRCFFSLERGVDFLFCLKNVVLKGFFAVFKNYFL